ncbi:hypothetical protein MCELHM10_02050 [Paracoccaceae bacterium]
MIPPKPCLNLTKQAWTCGVNDIGKRLLRRFGLQVVRCAPVTLSGRAVHYLHIGKTAGKQIGHVIEQINRAQSDIRMIKNGHGVTLRSVLPGDAYFFSLRDPVGRFRSGFYSRKRMGRPRLNNPWSPSEGRIFAEFEHASDLAEALFCNDVRGRAAMAAMLTIGHVGNSQVDWFKKAGDIFSLRPPIWIIRQKHLEADVATLLRRLGIGQTVTLTDDPVQAHVNDYSGTRPMSELALEDIPLAFSRYAVLRPLRGMDGRTTGLHGDLSSWR